MLEEADLNTNVIIYVKLLGEGINVWKPVSATYIENDTYLIKDNNFDFSIEEPEFINGDIVRTENHKFSDGSFGLIAIEKLE